MVSLDLKVFPKDMRIYRTPKLLPVLPFQLARTAALSLSWLVMQKQQASTVPLLSEVVPPQDQKMKHLQISWFQLKDHNAQELTSL